MSTAHANNAVANLCAMIECTTPAIVPSFDTVAREVWRHARTFPVEERHHAMRHGYGDVLHAVGAHNAAIYNAAKPGMPEGFDAITARELRHLRGQVEAAHRTMQDLASVLDPGGHAPRE